MSESFERQCRRALALYCAGVKDGAFEAAMDEINAESSDAEWEMLTRWLEEADLDLGATDAATLSQRERAAAQSEQRANRYPSMFSLYAMDETAHRTLRQLEVEHGIEAPDYGQRRR